MPFVAHSQTVGAPLLSCFSALCSVDKFTSSAGSAGNGPPGPRKTSGPKDNAISLTGYADAGRRKEQRNLKMIFQVLADVRLIGAQVSPATPRAARCPTASAGAESQ